MNAYAAHLHAALPRLLALFEDDPYSPHRGMGDRERWAWKTKDFTNGSFQGAAHGLARLLAAGLLPPGMSEAAVLRRIDAMFAAAAKIRRDDGSFEEAFPYESSFCVTALVAHDLLCAVELLGRRIEESRRARYLATVRPMIRFLLRSEETHAFIANHLATAAAALFRWKRLAGDDVDARARELLARVLSKQSSEGWFLEYEGADPGYQSLATSFLADVHRQRPDLGLLEPLRRSVQFLWYFAQPDGSFGGAYGSRATRFYFPAGIEALAGEIPEAAALAAFLRDSIERNAAVTLASVDAPNLVPMFNDYAWAACEMRERSDAPMLPCLAAERVVRDFPLAGLHVRGGPRGYSVVSTSKGGALLHVSKPELRLSVDAGTVASSGGRRYSTQSFEAHPHARVSAERIVVDAPLALLRHELLSPGKLILLRLLNLTAMRFRPLAEIVKEMLVRRLITGRRYHEARIERAIEWSEDRPRVSWKLLGDAGAFDRIESGGGFRAIHMASSGYWQAQDDA